MNVGGDGLNGEMKMGKQQIVTIVDDIDGTEGARLIEFKLDGKRYEIDLSAANEAKLREVLQPFIAAARKAGSAPKLVALQGGRRTDGRTSAPRELPEEGKREYLRAAGFVIGDRGRFSKRMNDSWTAEKARRAADAATTSDEAPEASTGDGEAPQETPPVTEGPVTLTKVGKLTGSNIAALREVDLLHADSGQTFAVIVGDVGEALAAVQAAMDRYPGRHSTRHSLVAVRNKLRKAEQRFVQVITK